MAEQHISPGTLVLIGAVDRLVVFIARHWRLLAALVLFIFSTLPILAPLLVLAGMSAPANVIYSLYSLTCHQLAFRSFFFGGEQFSYSVSQLQAVLHVDNPLIDLQYWRGVMGNTALGYKMAYCERDVAIYSSMFLAVVAFSLLRERLPRLNWRWYIAFGILPMLIDGGTQAFFWRESDPLLRAITGVLFGVLSVWLVFPSVGVAMAELGEQTAAQLAAVNRRKAGNL